MALIERILSDEMLCNNLIFELDRIARETAPDCGLPIGTRAELAMLREVVYKWVNEVSNTPKS